MGQGEYDTAPDCERHSIYKILEHKQILSRVEGVFVGY